MQERDQKIDHQTKHGRDAKRKEVGKAFSHTHPFDTLAHLLHSQVGGVLLNDSVYTRKQNVSSRGLHALARRMQVRWAIAGTHLIVYDTIHWQACNIEDLGGSDHL